MLQWGEEGKKWFASLRSVCPSSSHALNVEKKLLELKFSETKVALWRVAAAVDFRKNFKLSLPKAKLTFTVCSPTEFMALQKEGPTANAKTT